MQRAILALVLFLGFVSYSQGQSFHEGAQSLNGGIGLGSSLYVGGSSVAIPPLSVNYEYALTNRWGIGGIVGIAGARQTITTTTASSINGFIESNVNKFVFDYTSVLVGVRGAYHFYTNTRWDLYGGAALGLEFVSASYSDSDKNQFNLQSTGSFLNLGLFGGAKYFFNDRIGLFTELGYSVAFLNFGVAVKL